MLTSGECSVSAGCWLFKKDELLDISQNFFCNRHCISTGKKSALVKQFNGVFVTVV